ncbi:MAG: LysR family transcriptional regulator, partial [Rhizobiales bacterium]|nr:LysR family transcriptional regulator [Hyphomicrobiales bacterium]
VASPEYLQKYGIPSVPQDLTAHQLVVFSNSSAKNIWEYIDNSGKAVNVNINPKVTCNSASTELSLVKAGYGITRLPRMVCEAELKSGQLIKILENYEKAPLDFYAIYPSRAHLASKVRAFIDFIVTKFEEMK